MGFTRERPLHVRQQISNTMKGRKMSDETKAKISQTQKKNWEKVPPKQTTDTICGQSEDNKSKSNNNDDGNQKNDMHQHW